MSGFISCAPGVQGDISDIRKQVISGDWSPINRGEYTLTDLGLRHNGNGLVWLRSGVSVHEADHDEGFSGKARVSFDYHEGVCPARPEDGAGFSRGVHSHKVDSYCLHILTSSPSWVEYWHRNDGKALTTFAAQVLTNERQEAFDGWVIYRHPQQMDKYTVIHEERDKYLIQEYVKRGWKCESTYELSLLVKNDAEFGRLMARLGYRSKGNHSDDPVLFYVLPAVFRTEVARGFDSGQFARTLCEAGILKKSPSDKGYQTLTPRLRHVGNIRLRSYLLVQLDESEGAEQ